jgi:hypothetical protein
LFDCVPGFGVQCDAGGQGRALSAQLPQSTALGPGLLVLPEFVSRRDCQTHLYGEYERKFFGPGDQLGPVVEFCGLRVGILM